MPVYIYIYIRFNFAKYEIKRRGRRKKTITSCVSSSLIKLGNYTHDFGKKEMEAGRSIGDQKSLCLFAFLPSGTRE